jgi:hypothetical protein
MWSAVEQWLDEMPKDALEDAHQKGTRYVLHESVEDQSKEFTVTFTVGKQQGEFTADRVDGLGWELPEWAGYVDLDRLPVDLSCHPNQTFHLGVSCYGPDKSGKFRGAISVDSTTIHSKQYDTLDEARQETMGKLLECITVTLGFSRKEEIERLGKEVRHGRQNTGDNEGPLVDG